MPPMEIVRNKVSAEPLRISQKPFLNESVFEQIGSVNNSNDAHRQSLSPPTGVFMSFAYRVTEKSPHFLLNTIQFWAP